MPCFYLTPKQDDFNQELQVCIAEALYDVDSIVSRSRSLHKGRTGEPTQSDRVGSRTGVGDSWWGEDQLTATMIQISQVVARQFKIEK